MHRSTKSDKIFTQNPQTEREPNPRHGESGTRKNSIHAAHPHNLLHPSKSSLPSEKINQNGTFKARDRRRKPAAEFLTLGLRFSTAMLAAMANREGSRARSGNWIASQPGQRVSLSLPPLQVPWRIGGGERPDGWCLKGRAVRRTRTQANKRRRPVARRKASGTVEGERMAADHSCGFALTKDSIFP